MAWRLISDEAGGQYWQNTDTGEYSATDPTWASFGDPWQRDRRGWTPENIDAIFNTVAKSEAGNVGAQTLATLRQYGVDPNVALDALWRSATESANPYWAGGSPTGISRGIWEKAGILPMVDTPQLRAQQGQEDHNIWAGQQQGGDDGFGDFLKIGALIGGGLGLAGLAGLGPLAAAEGAAGFIGESAAGGGMFDWLGTDWGTEGLVDLGSSGYNAVAANDPIGALIQNLESGMTPSQAVSAVETALPGTTRSALEQFLYEAGVNSSNGISRLLGNSLGGQAANGSFAPTGESSSLLGILGKLAPSLLGAYASNQQTNALTDLAKKYQDFGAPYRQQLADITANPDNFYNSLGAQKATDSVLHKLSIGGNPSGSPYKQQLAIDSLWNEYGKERDRLAGFGGLTNYNAAAPNLEAQAIGQNANMWNAVGAGMNDIFNPKPALPDLLKQMKQAGF